MLRPKLEILPKPQRRLWDELGATPSDFTLYGGTAIALRLGHRTSVDFDFFSSQSFVPERLARSIAYLDGATLQQSAADTLSMRVERDGPVMISFFGAVGLGEVAAPDIADGPQVKVASLIDLAGTKVAVITQRAEVKDYLDIHALLTTAGISLAEMLAAGRTIYGSMFNPLVALKAIGYHDDPTLAGLDNGIRKDLTTALAKVDLASLPRLSPLRPRGNRL